MDERSIRLEQLKEQESVLSENYKSQRRRATIKLYDILKDLNNGPCELLIPDPVQNPVNIDTRYWSYDSEDDWEVREEIRFKAWKNDERGYDFGSDIDIYITKDDIKINHGSCGTWGLEEKGQWSRILLIKAIFDHQGDIIREMSQIVNLDKIKELYKVRNEISKINEEIRKEALAKETEEVRSLLFKSVGKYLATKGRHWCWPKDGEAEGHYEYHYYNHEKIEGITQKSVLTSEASYNWVQHRHKLDSIIYDLRNHNLYIVDNINVEPDPVETN